MQLDVACRAKARDATGGSPWCLQAQEAHRRTPVTVDVSGVSVMPRMDTVSPVRTMPCSMRPVTTVPRPCKLLQWVLHFLGRPLLCYTC